MSTRSTIIIKVKDEDIGKHLTFDSSKLPTQEDNWGIDGCNDKSIDGVTIEKKYLAIYCHSDGYLDGLGKTLTEKFTDYETVLNLIVGGDVSYIDKNSILRYATRNEEFKIQNKIVQEDSTWDELKPSQKDSFEYFCDSKCMNDFVYLFENNCWSYCTFNNHIFRDVAKDIQKNDFFASEFC